MAIQRSVLIVGAGFAGAVHARLLAEAGWHVQVIDRRNHLAGNAFDFVDKNGIRVHRYGPHLLHTKMNHVIEWLQRFAEFVPYRHVVKAKLRSGAFVPLPINLETVNVVFGARFETASQVERHLEDISEKIPNVSNAAEHLYAHIGRELTDIFFRPYTKKMWGLDLEDMAASVVQRIPIRFDNSDSYFSADERQVLPRDGYTDLFERILDHPRIRLTLGTAFRKPMERDYFHSFNSMPIDEYFDFALGELPYRSIRFHHRDAALQPMRGWSVTNFTDESKFTRETQWDCLPHHVVSQTSVGSVTLEEPCDYRDNDFERYYPVKTADQRYSKVYERYRNLAKTEAPATTFIGRCGLYQYLDMDQVINQSMTSARKWLDAHAP